MELKNIIMNLYQSNVIIKIKIIIINIKLKSKCKKSFFNIEQLVTK